MQCRGISGIKFLTLQLLRVLPSAKGLVIVALAVVVIIMDGMVFVLGLVFSGLCSDQPDREEAVKNMGLQIYLWTRRRMLHLQYQHNSQGWSVFGIRGRRRRSGWRLQSLAKGGSGANLRRKFPDDMEGEIWNSNSISRTRGGRQSQETCPWMAAIASSLRAGGNWLRVCRGQGCPVILPIHTAGGWKYETKDIRNGKM